MTADRFADFRHVAKEWATLNGLTVEFQDLPGNRLAARFHARDEHGGWFFDVESVGGSRATKVGKAAFRNWMRWRFATVLHDLQAERETIVGGTWTANGKDREIHPIVEAIARKHHLSVSNLRGRSRLKHIVAARHEAVLTLRSGTRLSTPQIARAVGLKDHTSVLHVLRKQKEIVE